MHLHIEDSKRETQRGICRSRLDGSTNRPLSSLMKEKSWNFQWHRVMTQRNSLKENKLIKNFCEVQKLLSEHENIFHDLEKALARKYSWKKIIRKIFYGRKIFVEWKKIIITMKHFHHGEQKVVIDEQIIVKKRILDRKFIVRTMRWCVRLHRADDGYDENVRHVSGRGVLMESTKFSSESQKNGLRTVSKAIPRGLPRIGTIEGPETRFRALFFTFFHFFSEFPKVWRSREEIVKVDVQMTNPVSGHHPGILWCVRLHRADDSYDDDRHHDQENILSTKVSSRMKI